MNDENVLLVRTYDHEGIPIVAAQGDVDLSTTPTLREVLEASCVEREGPGKIAVDMREVPFIDSAGLALLVEIRKRFADKCQLALIITERSQPERVLKLGRFDTFLQVCYGPDELNAVGKVAAGDAAAPTAA